MLCLIAPFILQILRKSHLPGLMMTDKLHRLMPPPLPLAVFASPDRSQIRRGHDVLQACEVPQRAPGGAVPAPSPAEHNPPPSPPGLFDNDSPGLGSYLLDGGSARQCHLLMCNSPAGEALEYQCWEAQSESTGLMAVMTMVALIVCPIGWFIIKLLGIKAEAYLNDEKEAVRMPPSIPLRRYIAPLSHAEEVSSWCHHGRSPPS